MRFFKVTDDECELSETSLIQYSMKDNKQRLDAVWWIDGMQYFFLIFAFLVVSKITDGRSVWIMSSS